MSSISWVPYWESVGLHYRHAHHSVCNISHTVRRTGIGAARVLGPPLLLFWNLYLDYVNCVHIPALLGHINLSPYHLVPTQAKVSSLSTSTSGSKLSTAFLPPLGRINSVYFKLCLLHHNIFSHNSFCSSCKGLQIVLPQSSCTYLEFHKVHLLSVLDSTCVATCLNPAYLESKSLSLLIQVFNFFNFPLGQEFFNYCSIVNA